ncbi:MAG: M1 family metallopeptidase [Nocardioidaceae bacterium]
MTTSHIRRTVALVAALALLLAGCSSAADVASGGGGTPSAPATSGGPSPGAPTTPQHTSASTTDANEPTPKELASARSEPVEDPYYPATSNPEVDSLHYNLELSWSGSKLTGATTLLFRVAEPTETVRLDLSSKLSVTKVRLDGGRSIDFSQADDGLLMQTGALSEDTRHTLAIDYSGVPGPTPAPSLRPDMTEGLGWVVGADGSVYTFQEPYGAFTWYPVNDHPSDKALYDAQITVPNGDAAVFNGVLEAKEPGESSTTWSWHMEKPAASYLTTIAIGPYKQHKVTMPGGTPGSYWLMPRDRHLLPILKRKGRNAFRWLEKRAGDYPFATFGAVVVGGESAMETQTMITMSRGVVTSPTADFAHEMSHQWFGDAVTPTDWQGLWLNEGWAMYMQQWYEEQSPTVGSYGGGMSSWWRLDNMARQRSGPPGDYDPQTFGDNNVYLGPAMMLDRIRRKIGDGPFRRLVRRWPAAHEYGNVDRAMFESWLDRETGRDFGPLMDRWLDSNHTPR